MSVDPRHFLADRRRHAVGEPHWPMPGGWLLIHDLDYCDMVEAGISMMDGLVDGMRGKYINGWRAYERALRRRKQRLPRGEHPVATALHFYIGRGGAPPQDAVIDVALDVYRLRLPGIRRLPTPK